jgi:NAD(P)H dehydrogenase (quinone)
VDILVLYYSRHGATRRLAEAIAQGIEQVDGAQARMRTVPPVTTVVETAAPPVPAVGPPYAELRDLEECGGLALGSPTRFGNMAAPLKYFLDGTSPLWLSVCLWKAAALFTTSTPRARSRRSCRRAEHGQKACFGTESELSDQSGGTPYGASHVARRGAPVELTAEERRLAVALGARLARSALRLAR